MKSIIISYSYSGNTKKVAEVLAECLKEKSQVDIVGLAALDESASFLGQAYRALRHKQAAIDSVNLDLGGYDLICFGTPVWAFAPAPAMNTYLEKCSGLEGKTVILFTTYGSGTGNERCLKYMMDILAAKGAGSFKAFSVQQFKVSDKDWVVARIKEAAVL